MENLNEKVSVIITTYKRSIHLKRAIESVLNQNYSNIELIVVDDNNSGTEYRRNVENIMSEYKLGENFKYIKHKENLNGAAARNSGIKNSSGKYIAFLDDDDVFSKNRIRSLVNELEKETNKEFGAIYSNVEIVYDSYSEYLNKIFMCNDGNMKKELLLENFGIGTGSNLFIRRNIVDKLNGFDERFKRHQDWEFLIRFFRISKIKYYDEILVKKYMDSRINFPNSTILEEVKELYLSEFEKDIKDFDVYTQKEIIRIHIVELINSCLNDNKILKSFKLKNKYNLSFNLKEYNNFIHIAIKGFVKKFIKGIKK